MCQRQEVTTAGTSLPPFALPCYPLLFCPIIGTSIKFWKISRDLVLKGQKSLRKEPVSLWAGGPKGHRFTVPLSIRGRCHS